MFLTVIYIISYFVIIELFYSAKKDKGNKTLKIKPDQVVLFFIIFELILGFFYSSTVRQLRVIQIDRYGEEFIQTYGRFFFSPFEMTYSHGNPFGFTGKVEAYPYLWIIFAGLIVMLVGLKFIKKYREYIYIGISSISIIILTIAMIDMLDSVYVNYVWQNGSFFEIVGPGYYFLIGMYLIMIIFNIMTIGRDKTIVVPIEYERKEDYNPFLKSNVVIIEDEEMIDSDNIEQEKDTENEEVNEELI